MSSSAQKSGSSLLREDAGLVVFRHPGLEHYQRLIEAARSRLADLGLDYGEEKSKVDSVRSRLFGVLRPYYQERDRLRLLIQYRKGSTRALACEISAPSLKSCVES